MPLVVREGRTLRVAATAFGGSASPSLTSAVTDFAFVAFFRPFGLSEVLAMASTSSSGVTFLFLDVFAGFAGTSSGLLDAARPTEGVGSFVFREVGFFGGGSSSGTSVAARFPRDVGAGVFGFNGGDLDLPTGFFKEPESSSASDCSSMLLSGMDAALRGDGSGE